MMLLSNKIHKGSCQKLPEGSNPAKISIPPAILLGWGEKPFFSKVLSLSPYIVSTHNTPGTAGGPGGRDRTLAVKSRKNVRKITFFS